MIKQQEGQLFDNMDGSTAYWQFRNNPAESERQQPYKQANRHSDDTGIILFGILFTIGFLALLAITTLRSIL